MAAASSINFQAFLAILLLLLLPLAVKGNGIFPPFIDNNICEEVQCGKGTCEANPNFPFNFKCNCDNGWKRTRFGNEQNLEYLPCIIPDCSLDYSCMPAAPPLPPVPYNISFFDPCYWLYCGQGTCTKNATYTHTCQCDYGHYNLLNISAYPCYSDCALGSDCQRLGIRVSRSTSDPSSNNNSNQATSFLPGKFHWIAIFLISTVMALWK
ncbi:EGF-like [Forsythia ovata]|uniref:EGF-like n=1 Tax=Forsythia ovata TaxID=205694 RepID=A0ABD1QPY5_9LAMI